MGLMHRFIYKFSILVSAAAGVMSLIQGTSILTSLFRAAVVFLGTLFIFVLSLHLLRWSIVATTVVDALDQEDEEASEVVTPKPNAPEKALPDNVQPQLKDGSQ